LTTDKMPERDRQTMSFDSILHVMYVAGQKDPNTVKLYKLNHMWHVRMILHTKLCQCQASRSV